jgi:4-hydroxy-3-methylbut-2-en-1-yl diphosphate reductase
MSRSTVRACLAPGTVAGRGEVLVATEIGDPARGRLPCPAAPLLGGSVTRRGLAVRYVAIPQAGDAAQADDGAALFVTTILHADGRATALGAAADGVDGLATAAARAAVEEWSAVTGSRRLLDAASPWCPGARDALEAARQAAAQGPVWIYGPLMASPAELADLETDGAVFTTSLPDIPGDATVVIPAHGAGPQVLAEAAGRGLAVIDATCPLVAGMAAECRRFAERGDQVVLIGQDGLAVLPGLLEQAPGQAVAAETRAGAGAVSVHDPRRVSYLLVPGIPVEETGPAVTALRSRFPALRGPDPDGFCYAASDRIQTARAVAASADMVLVLGAENDPDTRHLAALSRASHAKANVIGDVTEIRPDWVGGTLAIGLAVSTAAPPGLAAAVSAALSGLGPLSLTTRTVRTEVTGRSQVTGRNA